jgi:hypothetical protein
MDSVQIAHISVRYVAAILATVLAAGIAMHAWRQRSFGLGCLAGWVAAVAGNAWILSQVVSPADPTLPLKALLVASLGLLAAPLLPAYVLHALHQRKLHWLAFSPFLLHALAALVLGVALNQWVRMLAVVGVVYTVARVIYCAPRAERQSLAGATRAYGTDAVRACSWCSSRLRGFRQSVVICSQVDPHRDLGRRRIRIRCSVRRSREPWFRRSCRARGADRQLFARISRRCAGNAVDRS